MYSSIITGAIHGIDSYLMRVETDISNGLPSFNMVGFMSGEMREAGERVRVAFKNLGIHMPPQRITVNLSPAGIPKRGMVVDLPVSVGLLVCLGYIPEESVNNVLVAGELGLNGEIRPVKGILSIVMEAKANGISTCLVPNGNLSEGALVHGIRVVGVRTLAELVNDILNSANYSGDYYGLQLYHDFTAKEIKEKYINGIKGRIGNNKLSITIEHSDPAPVHLFSEDADLTFSQIQQGISDIKNSLKDILEIGFVLPLPRVLRGNVYDADASSTAGKPVPCENFDIELIGVVSATSNKDESDKNPCTKTDSNGNFVIILPERYSFKEEVRLIIKDKTTNKSEEHFITVVYLSIIFVSFITKQAYHRLCAADKKRHTVCRTLTYLINLRSDESKQMQYPRSQQYQ